MENKVTVKGVMLGENTMLALDSVQVFSLDPSTGKRHPQKKANKIYGK